MKVLGVGRAAARCAMQVLLVLALLLPAAACRMSEQQEIQLGQRVHRDFEQEFGGLYPNENVQAYVNQVGMEMARYAGRPNLPWQFRVLNSEQINAFAVPGGFIYITEGLLYRLNTEAQLAAILGHEAGHIAHRHSVRQIQRAQQAQGLAIFAGILGGPDVMDVAGIVAGLTLMSYSRDQEREADLSGLRYLVQGGYNPRGMVQTMEVLQAEHPERGPPSFLLTHPPPANRIAYLQDTIARDYRAAVDTGRSGEGEFRQRVLEGRRISQRDEEVDLSHPVSWCMTCGSELLAAALSAEGELLREE